MSQAQVQDQAEYIDEVDSCSLEPSKQSSNHQNRSLPSTSKRKRPTVNTTSTPQTSSMRTSRQQPPLTDLFSSSVANADNDDMSDGKNEARAIRVIEIMNDFRTLQHHITSLVVRQESNPPDQAAYYLTGYVVLRECSLAAQTILATHFNPGSLGLQPGQVPATEVQKATLQRILLDASTRRFQAHRIYLRAAAGMRWVHLRAQLANRNLDHEKLAAALGAIDARLNTELSNITDESVVNDLRDADRRKSYWLDEDPTLERMLAWTRRQT